MTSLLNQLPDAEPAPAVADGTALLDALAGAAAHPAADTGPGPAVEALPEVVLVHERIGPTPALELIREIALRFPAVGVVLITTDAGPALFSAAMDAGARGIVGLPLGYDELAARVQAAAQWAAGVRVHLGGNPEARPGPAGRLVTVTGAKGGVGTTVAAVQLALAARAAGRSVALVDLDLQSGDVASYLDVQFRRSIVDLAGIQDLSVRVLQDAVHDHHTGLALLLAPEEGERGEEVDDRAARQILGALRSRYEVVVVDCGSQMQSANAAAVELADVALLVTTRTWWPYGPPSGRYGCGTGCRSARPRTPPRSSTGSPAAPRSSRRWSPRPPAPGRPGPTSRRRTRNSSRVWTPAGCRTWTPGRRSSRRSGRSPLSWGWSSHRPRGRAGAATGRARR
ncbi:AAA family ATPase [Streptomyces endophytica]|uniref:AAA family ATPase n=1 Tax=Streptomyces endophytica TaxID=2991496 RepID=UPI003C6FE45E